MAVSFSKYLELARVVATLMVFLGHGKIFYAPLERFIEPMNLGRDAVIIFFVLSGYVISWCGREREQSALDFGVNRAARIYSVAIPAVALSFAASATVSWYHGAPLAYQFAKAWLYVPIYLGFAGSLGTLNEFPPTNFPFWSLNYEVWYYVLFGLWCFGRGMWRWAGLVATLGLLGPEALGLWPIWLMGSVLHQKRGFRLPATWAPGVLLLTILGYGAVKTWGVDNWLDQTVQSGLGRHGLSRLKEPLLGDYCIGVLVVINFAAARSLELPWNESLVRAVRAVAAVSFSLYLFHMPIFEVVALLPLDRNSALSYAFVMLGAALAIAVLAQLTERRKSGYRDWLRSVIARYWREPG